MLAFKKFSSFISFCVPASIEFTELAPQNLGRLDAAMNQ